MADDDQQQDKTEAPTPRKRQQAREQGNVAKSADLSAAALLVAALVLLWLTGGRLWSHLAGVARDALGGDLADPDVRPLAVSAVKDVVAGMWPLMVGLAFVAVVANVGQIGLILSTKKLEPNPKVLDPIAGFKKLFFTGKTYVGFAMNVGKLVIVAAVAWWAASVQMPVVLALSDADAESLAVAGGMSVFAVGLKVALALLVLALLDFAYQKWKHEQDLKMTKQEVKDEHKTNEGDPHLKSRRRQIAMQRATQRIDTALPTADVVVTNPTHFAVAIKYDEAKMGAPRVVAKGADLLAARIRELAAANRVTVVERPPLARALYRAVEVGREIPEDFYSAVAEILAYVYRLDRELAGGRK